jgi:hypothetical protein
VQDVAHHNCCIFAAISKEPVSNIEQPVSSAENYTFKNLFMLFSTFGGAA